MHLSLLEHMHLSLLERMHLSLLEHMHLSLLEHMRLCDPKSRAVEGLVTASDNAHPSRADLTMP